jgi:hypothetical protein
MIVINFDGGRYRNGYDEIFVDNRVVCTEIPFLPVRWHGTGFIPITPGIGLVRIPTRKAQIRFAAYRERGESLIEIIDSSNRTLSRSLAQSVRLLIPNDPSRYEHSVAVTFPNNGRFTVQLWLQTEQKIYSLVTEYRFKVTDAPATAISPVGQYFRGRTFVPLPERLDIKVDPPDGVIVTKQAVVPLRVKFRGKLLLKLWPVGEEGVAFWPKTVGTKTKGEWTTERYEVTIPDFGPYVLSFFLNYELVFMQQYLHKGNALPKPDEAERAGLKVLKNAAADPPELSDIRGMYKILKDSFDFGNNL